MKYVAQFRNINEDLYTVNIITDGDESSTTQLVLGDSPFTMEGSNDDDLFKPCKYSSAVLKIIAKDYYPDFYSSKAQQNKLILYNKNNEVEWVGYVTPNIYSQGYEASIEELEIEAIDGLSTLQYFKYEPILSSKDIVSFKALLFYLINKCNCYTKLRVSKSCLGWDSNISIIEQLLISEQNFFDEDDEPMTLQEILEQICKYLNLTCIAYGDTVNLIDYDDMLGEFYEFKLDDSTYQKIVTLGKTETLSGDEYRLNGTQITLDNTYNKVILKDSLYSFDSIIPDLWDDGKLTNYKGAWNYYENVLDDKYQAFFKYYKHSDYESYYYDVDYLGANGFSSVTQVYPSTINYANTQNYVGATICRHYCYKVEDDKPSTLKWDDYLLLHCHRPAIYDSAVIDTLAYRPLFSLKINSSPPAFISPNAYFVIQGSICWMDLEGVMYKREHNRESDDFNEDNLYIPCSLQVDNMYWNGSQWISSFTVFNLPFDSGGQDAHYIGKDFQIKNNIDYTMGLDIEGYSIPMPTEYVTKSKPYFSIYAPPTVNGSHRVDAVWLKNFDIKCALPVDEKVDKDSDTEYTNIIDDDFVEEHTIDDFKICTWDNKEVNFSAVAYLQDSHYHFVDQVLNSVNQNLLRPEEHTIQKFVNQYSTPSIKLNLNLKKDFLTPFDKLKITYFNGKQFVVDVYSIDYRYDKAEYFMIEKK